VGSIGPAEVIVVLIVGLIVLGPHRLPEAARQIGKAVAEFRKVTAGLQAEVRDVFTEPVPGTPPVPPAPTSPPVAEQAALTPAPAASATPAPATPTLETAPAAAEVVSEPSAGPAPWANPAIPPEGPSWDAAAPDPASAGSGPTPA
jgi:TatA/E family protein of Tat protein translocase